MMAMAALMTSLAVKEASFNLTMMALPALVTSVEGKKIVSKSPRER